MCPHCGQKREGVKPTYTKAEIQALIASDEVLHGNEDSFGLIKSLIAPHKHSHGIARVLELVLTGLTLPAVLIGALGIAAFRGRKARTALLSTTGELLPVFVMTLVGGGAIWQLLGYDYAALAITAMWARAAVRIISAGRHERAQLAPERAQLAAPKAAAQPPTSTAALPPARVVTLAKPVEVVRPSAPVMAPTKAVEVARPSASAVTEKPVEVARPSQRAVIAASREPRTDDAGDASNGPRFLR